jgi:hypothetical protein
MHVAPDLIRAWSLTRFCLRAAQVDVTPLAGYANLRRQNKG